VRAVIDLVNGSQTARAAYDALTKGGRSVQVGLFGGEISVALPVMAMRELTIGGSYVGSPIELRELIGLAQGGRLAALPVENVPRAHANEALMRLRDGRVRGRIVLVADAA
jgi:alcohol dehydrogenase/propanol-preferring alcohol dehydrogenase